jgi:hypothetical protein
MFWTSLPLAFGLLRCDTCVALVREVISARFDAAQKVVAKKYVYAKSRTQLTHLQTHCISHLNCERMFDTMHPQSSLIGVDKEKFILINDSLVITIMSKTSSNYDMEEVHAKILHRIC